MVSCPTCTKNPEWYLNYIHCVLPYLSAMYSVVVNLFLSQAQEEEADPCLMDKVIGKDIYPKY